MEGIYIYLGDVFANLELELLFYEDFGL